MRESRFAGTVDHHIESDDGYYSVELYKGEIISIETRDFRSGGVIWRKIDGKIHEYNDSKLEYMKDVAEDHPDVYERVKELCPGEKLPSLSKVKRSTRRSKIKGIELRIKAHERELQELRKEKAELKKKLGG